MHGAAFGAPVHSRAIPGGVGAETQTAHLLALGRKDLFG